MEDIVAVAAAISDLGGILYGGRPLRCRRANALVSQLAEETDSKPVQCEFESHRGHHNTAVAVITKMAKTCCGPPLW